MLNKNTYFQTDPLVAREFIVAPCPYSLIVEDFINMYYPENKGIREEGVGVVQATKGDLENKGFFDIQSNSLNLPRLIQIYNPVADARNEYIYSASGQKLKVLHIWDPYFQTTPILGTDENFGSPVMMTTTDYVGNMIYENGGLKRILIDGGYIENGVYYYYLTDHLGNNRVVANASGVVVQKNHYYPFGVAFAETSAAEQGKQPYKFGGKELDQMNGLNLYDVSARFYDPALPNTLTPDPLCEIYYPISQYTWCMNNPVNAVDPTGRSTWVIQDTDSTFHVVDGDLDDGDDNIYTGYYDKNHNFVRCNPIGRTTSMTSFYDSYANGKKGDWARGSIINKNDQSGRNFLSKIMSYPDIDDYMENAEKTQKYDFKYTNGTGKKLPDDQFYRGMPLGKTKDGQMIYTSAKDIGNIAAGYVAGVYGTTWNMARKEFDGLQSVQDGHPTVELPSTQNAERVGWEIGNRIALENPVATLYRVILSRTAWKYLFKK